MRFFTVKVINVFTVTLSVLFFLSATVATLSNIENESRMALEFEQMIKDANEFNRDLTDDLLGDGDQGEQDVQKYFTAKDAFLDAYYNYINAESYHVVTTGISTNEVKLPVGTVTISTYSKNNMIKYLNGDFVFELVGYDPDSPINMTSGKCFYYQASTDRIYLRETTNVRKVGEDLIPTYTSGWKYDEGSFFEQELGIVPGESIYDFKASGGILKEEFDVSESRGKIREYQTVIHSVPSKVGKPYSNVIQYMVDGAVPTIINMKATATISPDGILKTLSLSDKFKIKVKGFDVIRYSGSDYKFVQMGGEINVPKPDFTGAVHR